MSTTIPLSPSFASLSTAQHSLPDTDDPPPTPKVRFDEDCVLIPDPVPHSRLPRLVTKSYSLPLWKRKNSSLLSEDEDEPQAPGADDHVVFKVSVPSLTTKARSPSRDAAHRPLVSCLVHHPHEPSPAGSSTSSFQSPRTGRPRRASLPQPIQPDAVKIPLRACCAQCYHCIDKCMKEGDHWKVHFSKGAARRRKSISDSHCPSPPRPARHRLCEALPSFDAIIAVDEVERRRRSTDLDPLTTFTLAMPPASSVDHDDVPLRRALSLNDAVYPNQTALISCIPHSPPASPIPEEDERRTPIPSPFGSSTNLAATRTASTTLIQRLTTDAAPLISAPISVPEKAAAHTPPSATETEESYFVVAHPPPPLVHDASSPASSPSSSPRIEHTRPSGRLAPQRKRSHIALPGPSSFFRASSQMLKGMTSMGGMPMSV
ncbi:hypothetical protein BD413DRAFT_237668 [Trametes elegans]|nr:hypothetical protein BD413DRAFT_237668 [Trametes elegans]